MKTKTTILCSALIITSISIATAAPKKDYADTDSNGTLSLAEFLEAKTKTVIKKGEKQGHSEEKIAEAVKRTKKWATKSFKKADANNDGELDDAERASLVKKKKKK